MCNKHQSLGRRIAATLLAAALLLALGGCNLIPTANNSDVDQSQASGLGSSSSSANDSGSAAGEAQLPEPGAEVQAGDLAPDFDFKDIDGRSGSLYDYRGQVVLINLWASWCPPCVGEMPEIDDLRG
ncbi:MAG: TlpA family protein disulfide reductase, partial [Coriobacteriales bacterium]|nr:TlpA family protein disulfide reductase [Coriobacteriales bacterium]